MSSFFLEIFLCNSNFDALVKSRHSGENWSPDGLQLLEKTGFRLSPELRKTVFLDFLRERQY